MKKAIILTYYFPPSGKASLHLPLGIIKHLPEFGIEPIVVTVNNEGFAAKDDAFSKLISPDLRVYKTDTWEPFELYKKLTGKKKDEQLVASETVSLENKSIAHRISLWIRLNLFVPDARIGWYRYAKQQCIDLISNEKIDYIISFGPPHSTHLIAKAVSEQFGVPYYPFLIDPWIDIAYYKGLKRSAITMWLDKRFERNTVENSEANIFVTEQTRADFVQKYPAISNKSHVIHWGYHEDMFREIGVNAAANEAITIVHAGNIFDFQNPENLWRAITKIIATGKNVSIKFIGTVSPAVVKSINEAGLSTITKYLGFLPYKQMLDELANADILLVCPSEPRHVPGKLFEYLRIGKPVLAIGEENPEVDGILRNASCGQFIKFSESPEEFIINLKKVNPNLNFIESFERKNLTKKFANILLKNRT